MYHQNRIKTLFSFHFFPELGSIYENTFGVCGVLPPPYRRCACGGCGRGGGALRGGDTLAAAPLTGCASPPAVAVPTAESTCATSTSTRRKKLERPCAALRENIFEMRPSSATFCLSPETMFSTGGKKAGAPSSELESTSCSGGGGGRTTPTRGDTLRAQMAALRVVNHSRTNFSLNPARSASSKAAASARVQHGSKLRSVDKGGPPTTPGTAATEPSIARRYARNRARTWLSDPPGELGAPASFADAPGPEVAAMRSRIKCFSARVIRTSGSMEPATDTLPVERLTRASTAGSRPPPPRCGVKCGTDLEVELGVPS